MPSTPPVRFTVLFDLDGTLINKVELILSSARFAFADRDGPRPTDGQWASGLGTPLVTQFREWARDEGEVTRLVARYREHQLAHHDILTTPYEGMRQALESLKEAGHTIGVVTSKTNALSRRGLAHTNMVHCIDCIVGCDDTTKHKPDPEPVLVALARLGGDASRAVFVGDSPFDIAAGNAAGVCTVGALWGPFPRSELERAGAQRYAALPCDLPALIAELADSPGTGATLVA
ncbi:MAG: HAD family hydrolase [Gemmatimonadaceae bacterium]